MKKLVSAILLPTLVMAVGCTSTTSAYENVFLCESGQKFEANLGHDIAQLRFDTQIYSIPRIPSASGMKYISNDRNYRLFVKGESALLMVHGNSYRGCKLQH
ncbi:TPA: MliC family protein [Vibrio campbellii]|uniref:MliC family protein n=1 Tax=Vibrio campbellii TaxID=680 RepID=UPI00390A91EB